MNSKKDVRSQPGAPSGGPGRPAGSGDGRNAARDQQSEPAGDGRNQCARGRHSASGPQPALPAGGGAALQRPGRRQSASEPEQGPGASALPAAAQRRCRNEGCAGGRLRDRQA